MNENLILFLKIHAMYQNMLYICAVNSNFINHPSSERTYFFIIDY